MNNKINKKDVIRLLETIAVYLELKGENPFRAAAFRKAAASLEGTDFSLSEINDFTKLPGIGKSTSAVIEEYIRKGRSTLLEELKEEVPKGLIPLLKLPGLGGKRISRLYQELNIKNADDLKEACLSGKVSAIPGFGKKTEEKLLAVLLEAGKTPERLPLAYMLPVAAAIEQALSEMPSVEKFSRAGSLRRMRETVKDLDFVIATRNPGQVRDLLLQLNNIKEVKAKGDTKVSVIFSLEHDVPADFRLVFPEHFASALHHFTGSKEHNVRMRQLAKKRGEKINEYGVELAETGKIITFASEEELFARYGLPWIPPELREDGSEVDVYAEDMDLISVEHIRGDLHMHTTWSDGAHSLEEMVEACRIRGYQYMAITDHSQYLRVARGLTPDRLRRQKEEIARLNERYKDIKILAGVEMDILPDGTLDYDDDLLEEMDLVIASIHSGFSQPEEKIMERLSTALKNANVHIIAHPTGRLIGQRDGYRVDMDMLIQMAKETKTVLELNANPHRLDLSEENLRKAQDAGVIVAINTDAHQAETLAYMEIGVAAARKGWIRKSTVLNALPLDGLLDFLQNR